MAMKFDTDDQALDEAIKRYKDSGEGAALQVIRAHFRADLSSCRELLTKHLDKLVNPPKGDDASNDLIDEAVGAMEGLDEATACALELIKLRGETIPCGDAHTVVIPLLLSRLQEIHAAYYRILSMGLNPRRLFAAYERGLLQSFRDPATGEAIPGDDVDTVKLHETLREHVVNAIQASTLSADILKFL